MNKDLIAKLKADLIGSTVQNFQDAMQNGTKGITAQAFLEAVSNGDIILKSKKNAKNKAHDWNHALHQGALSKFLKQREEASVKTSTQVSVRHNSKL